MTLVLLLTSSGGGRLVDTACSRRCHASIKSRQTSPTGDERQNKRKSGPARPTASNRVSSPPGREHLLRVGRHRRAQSEQQASRRQRDGGRTPAPRCLLWLPMQQRVTSDGRLQPAGGRRY